MTESSVQSRIGIWELHFSLRDMSKPKVAHTSDEVLAVINTFAGLRRRRKELCFDTKKTFVAVGGGGYSPDLCRVRGVLDCDYETAVPVLDELALCVGAQCGQKIVEIFIPSKNPPNGVFTRRFTLKAA